MTEHPSTPRGSSRAYVPGRWCWIVIGLCVIGIAAARSLVNHLDSANVNVATLILAFVAFMAISVWFVLISAYPTTLRVIYVVLILGIVAGLAARYEIADVSGSLVPTFRLRGSEASDRRLEVPELQEVATPVDLAATTPDDFPQFLGPNRDLVIDSVQLERDWESHPPEQLWKQAIGAGWSGFSAVNGYAVTLEQRGEEELVTCYEIATGELHWSHAIAARHETILGGVGPRSTPTIYGGNVYALGATGVLRCLRGEDGQLLWQHDLLESLGVTAEEDMRSVAWGRAASPLVVGDQVVVPYGGPRGGPHQSLAAFDRHEGHLLWTGGDRQISFASPTLATLAETPQIVIVNEDAVSAHDPETGTTLWQYDWDGSSTTNASASQAVPLEGDRVLLSKGYGGGAMLLRIGADGDGQLRAEEVWRNRRVLRTKFTNVAVLDGYAYGLSDGILECIDLDTGQRQWKAGRFGHGQILAVGDALLVQAESGEVAMVDATAEAFRQLGAFPALDSKTWNNLCLFGPYLLVRNAEEAACFRLKLR